MRNVNVGFDLDDVIFPWYDEAHRICVEEGLTTPDRTPRTWTPYEEYGVSLEEWIDVMNAAAYDGRLYRAAPFPGVVEAMNKLACNIPGWDIRIPIITARGFWAHGEIVREHTLNQLQTHKVPYSWITYSKDKTAVRPLEFFLEDNIHNYDALTATGTNAFLLNRPWNEGADDRQRVKSVREYVDKVIAILNPPRTH